LNTDPCQRRSLSRYSHIVLLGSSVRALAQSCHQLPCFRLTGASGRPSLWAIDQFADQDCSSVADKVSQIDLSEVSLDLFGSSEQTVSGELLFLPGGGTENHAELAQQIAANHHWCGIVGPQLTALRDPTILLDIASRVGLQAPPTYTHKTLPNRQSFVHSSTDLLKNADWLWKSSNKGGGLGVSRLHTQAEWDYFFSQTGSDYLQQVIPGVPYGATIIISANGKGEFVGACRLLTASDQVEHLEISQTSTSQIQYVHTSPRSRPDFPYLFAGALGPCYIPADVQQKLLRLAEACFHEFGIKGWFQIDFILDSNQQAWILEVNPRWSATMEIYERSLGLSLTAKHIQAWGVEVPVHAPNRRAQGLVCWKEVIYAESDFLWTDAHQLHVAELNRQQIHTLGWPLVADVPNVLQSFAPGMPICSIIAVGRTEIELQHQRSLTQSILST
jgi:hypothetical protein